MANSLSQNQIYTIINAINAQAKTGGTLTAVDTSSFTTVAQTLLLSGYDNLMSSISQVLSQTIFSHRPYTAILDILYADRQRFGNHVRKLVPLAEAIESALHKAFEAKRIRGEWFNLSEQDVIDLKITLS